MDSTLSRSKMNSIENMIVPKLNRSIQNYNFSNNNSNICSKTRLFQFEIVPNFNRFKLKSFQT